MDDGCFCSLHANVSILYSVFCIRVLCCHLVVKLPQTQTVCPFLAQDFWLSVLHKRLVGPEVLKVETVSEDGDRRVRSYLHCASRKR